MGESSPNLAIDPATVGDLEYYTVTGADRCRDWGRVGPRTGAER